MPSNQIIRGQLRNWHRDGKHIRGQVYQDQQDVYDDGDEIILLNIKRVHQGSTFFLIECETSTWRADIDEMKINGNL